MVNCRGLAGSSVGYENQKFRAVLYHDYELHSFGILDNYIAAISQNCQSYHGKSAI